MTATPACPLLPCRYVVRADDSIYIVFGDANGGPHCQADCDLPEKYVKLLVDAYSAALTPPPQAQAIAAVDGAVDWRKVCPNLDGIYNSLCHRFAGHEVDLIMERIAGEIAALTPTAGDGAVVRVCHICGGQTQLACSDCQINLAATVYVCSKGDCRRAHDRVCSGERQPAAALTPASPASAEVEAVCKRLDNAALYSSLDKAETLEWQAATLLRRLDAELRQTKDDLAFGPEKWVTANRNLKAELATLRTAFRVNMMRFGATDAEIDAVLYPATPAPTAGDAVVTEEMIQAGCEVAGVGQSWRRALTDAYRAMHRARGPA